MSPTIDFTQVKSLDPIPDGAYPAEIVEAKEGVSQKGNAKISLTWRVMGGEYDGRKVYDNLTFTPDSAWRAKKTLVALGWSPNFAGDVTGESLLGMQAVIAVGLDTQNGVDENGEPYPARNKVLNVKPLNAAPKTVKDLK